MKNTETKIKAPFPSQRREAAELRCRAKQMRAEIAHLWRRLAVCDRAARVLAKHGQTRRSA